MPQFSASIGHLTPTQQGVYVASILLAAAASSLASGHVSDAISRRYGILTGAILSIVGTVLSAASPTFSALIVARLVSGAGFGQCIAVSTVYLVELAPKSIRGVAACMVQLYVVIGITVGYFISYGSQGIHGELAWRLPFIVQAGFAVVLAVGVFFMPSSPRWLLQKGRRDDAIAVLHRYRGSEQKVEQEMSAMDASLENNTREKNVSFMVMFQKRYIKRTMLGVFLMSFQQLTGVSMRRQPLLCDQNAYHHSLSDRCRPLLCPDHLSAGRHRLDPGHFFGIWGQRNRYACLDNPRPDLDRPLGKTATTHLRRRRHVSLPHSDWFTIC